MKNQLLRIGCFLSVFAIVSCSTTHKTTYTDSAKINNTITEPTPNEDGIIPGTWKACVPGDNPCFQQHFLKYLVKNFTYPSEARIKNFQGKVYVNFDWDEQGVLDKNSIVVERSSGYNILDQAAVDLILHAPNLDIPATKDGKPVRFNYTFPVRFKIK